MNARLAERHRLAVEIADLSSVVVEAAEEALAAAEGPTARDIAETRLRAAYEQQDVVLAEVGPTIADRERAMREAVREVARAVRGEVGSDWTQKHRRWMSPALKSALIRRYGRRAYEELPW
jgi:hypothetical protein